MPQLLGLEKPLVRAAAAAVPLGTLHYPARALNIAAPCTLRARMPHSRNSAVGSCLVPSLFLRRTTSKPCTGHAASRADPLFHTA